MNRTYSVLSLIYGVSHVYEEYALILCKLASGVGVSYRVYSGVYSRTLHANRVKKQALSASHTKNETCFFDANHEKLIMFVIELFDTSEPQYKKWKILKRIEV